MDFFSQIINGLGIGSIYALVALGYSMLFRPTGLLGRSEFSLMRTVEKIKRAVSGKKQNPASKKEG